MLRYFFIFLSSVFSLFAQNGVSILGSDTYFEFMDSTEIFLNYDEINKCLGNEFYEYGIASFYARKFQGRKTANGEIFKQGKLTAAHKTLPFGSIVKVISMKDNKIILVRINDRGPFVKGRVIDLSKKAAGLLDIEGLQRVKIYTLLPKSYTLPINESYFYAYSFKHEAMCVNIDRMHILDEINDFDEAMELLQMYIQTFGSDDYYLCIETNNYRKKGKNRLPPIFYICKIKR